MSTYIISAHGKPDFNAETSIPQNITVHYYNPFGRAILNDVCLKLQWALTHPNELKAKEILNQLPTVALWNMGKQKPDLSLTGDMKDFQSGIVYAETNEVVYKLNTNQLITLTWALDFIRKRHDLSEHIDVYALFCLGDL
jgi:hypothetical protein